MIFLKEDIFFIFYSSRKNIMDISGIFVKQAISHINYYFSFESYQWSNGDFIF